MDGNSRIAPADNRQGVDIGNTMDQSFGPFGKGFYFKGTHGAVPNNRFRIGKCFSIARDRGRSDIQSHLIPGHLVHRHHLDRCIGIECRRRHDVHRQEEVNSFFSRDFHNIRGGFKKFRFHSGLPYIYPRPL